MIQGVCYSPVPINQSVYWDPLGDYFTDEYSFIWLRDLPLMKAMGANVVRIYGWDSTKSHRNFLDAVLANGLYLMTTFYVGDATETSISTQEERDDLVEQFAKEVAVYKDHPALLIWSFGNEINGVWNGFLQQLSKSEEDPCDWDEEYDDLGGCWVHLGKAPWPGTRCYKTSACVYQRLYSFLDDTAKAAHAVADVIVVSTFADVDALYDKVERMGHFAPNLDAWSAQVYRGASFGDFFAGISNGTSKPLILTEYGVDAYHDSCGDDRVSTPCFNTLGDKSGSYEDEAAQSEYAYNLTMEIMQHRSDLKHCVHADKGSPDCSCIGGFLMSWVDEYWKGSKSQATCKPTYSDAEFSPKTCDLKAHVTCGNWDTSEHDLCGYFLDAAPDHYVNEEWFGITAPTLCADGLDALRPRDVFFTMHAIWAKPGDPAPSRELFDTCHQVVEKHCADLGSPNGVFPWVETVLLFLSHGYTRHYSDGREAVGRTSTHYKGKPVCSGHGQCTTDSDECGPGGSNFTATPCCTCDMGFAGVGCAELDARMYVGVFVLTIAAMLLTSMLLISIGRRSCTKQQVARQDGKGEELRSALEESLLS